jgi:N-acetyl-1-D-myo-inositol-2-amino-2-deoxy-alpha-D-glucopyranoside deacetylase
VAFIQADDTKIQARLLAIMREINPTVLLTFGADGVYGHPDHLKIHAAATSAAELLAREADAPPALYYNAVPKSRIAEMAKRPNGPFKNATDEQIATYGTPDELITTLIDISTQFERKMRAIRSHRTQIAADGPWGDRPESELRELLQFERFRLVELVDRDPGIDPLRDFCSLASE